jgi:hypothetical protein
VVNQLKYGVKAKEELVHQVNLLLILTGKQVKVCKLDYLVMAVKNALFIHKRLQLNL